MTQVLSRSERRKITTFNRLIRASYKVLSRKGLFRATLDEITEEADVGKGTIYCHFRNKLDLVSHLTQKSIDDLLNYCKQEIMGIEDPYELIRKLISAHFTFFAEKKALFNILFFIRGALHQDFENRYIREIQNHYKRYISFLADTLDQGIKKGVFRPFNSMNQAYVLHGIIIGFVSQWIINERKELFVDKAELVSETFLQGIGGAERKNKKISKQELS
jgi:AcrR family transcriptional regulator